MTDGEAGGESSSSEQSSAQEDLSRVRAIALDTNAFGGRLPHMGRLGALVRRARKHGSIEVWVPESVLWEWTEHIHSDMQSAQKVLQGLQRIGREIPSLDTPPVTAVEEDLRRQLSEMGSPLRLLEVRDVAAQALRDQLLLLGPAKPKPARDGSVKTGAADSAHLRAFESAAQDGPSTYVVISADGDAKAGYKKWGKVAPRIFGDLRSATDAVFASVPSSTQVATSCLTSVRDRLEDLDIGRLNGKIVDALYEFRGRSIANESFYAEEGLQLVGVSGVQIDLDEDFAHGMVHLLGVVKATGIVQDALGDSLVQEWREAAGAHIRIAATFDLEGGAVTSFVLDTDEGDTTLPAGDDFPTDEEEALDLVMDALRALPGLDDLDWNPLGGDLPERKVETGLGEIALSFDAGGGHPDDGDTQWTLHAEHAHGTAEIACYFLNDGAWDAEAAGDFPGHFALSTDVRGLARLNPAWAINAVVIGLSDYDPTDARQWH